jgi:DHA2 family multidrug resistance protein
MQQQAQTLAYRDMYFILCAAALLIVPLGFLLRKNKPGGGGEIAIH